ncbi:MAG: hypothetical protein R2751_01895 [Bacteroidales bacterium]
MSTIRGTINGLAPLRKVTVASPQTGVAAGIQEEDTVTGRIEDPFLGGLVVVAGKHDVESRDFPGHMAGGIFIQIRIRIPPVAQVGARMEQTDQEVRLFLDPDPFHPDPGGFRHVPEFHVRPQVFRQPLGDARGDQAQYGDFEFSFPQDRIGREGGLPRPRVHRIGCQPGKVHLAFHFPVHDGAGFDVVVPHRGGLVPHEIHDPGTQMGTGGVHKIGIIYGGLTLEKVPVVEEDKGRVPGRSLSLCVSGHLGQGGGTFPVVDEIVGKNRSMHIGGDGDPQDLRCGLAALDKQDQQEGEDEQGFIHVGFVCREARASPGFATQM